MAFRSPGARPSPRIQKQLIPEGPIQDFSAIIEKTSPEDWRKRTSVFETLVSKIPSPDQDGNVHDGNNMNHWYRSAPALRHLAKPVSELLKDARSTVVKRTCEALNDLFSKCKSDARYLLKDLMPAVCQVHACTVQVIRNYVQDMILETLPKFPCKMTMPVWLDRLKNDKSRTVREACSLYLTSSMSSWGEPTNGNIERGNNTYLSREIYQQVGSVMIKTLRDPSPLVRQNCKKGLEVLMSQRRDILDELINDQSLTRDVRTMKLLKRLQAGETGLGDDMSVASRMSTMSTRSRGGFTVASAPVKGSRSVTANKQRTTRRLMVPFSRRRQRTTGSGPGTEGSPVPQVPTTIGVSTPPTPSHSSTNNNGVMGPPRRVATGKSPPKDSSASKTKSKLAHPLTPTRIPASPSGMALSTPTQQLLGMGMGMDTVVENKIATPISPLDYEVEQRMNSNGKEEDEAQGIGPDQSFDSNDTDISVLRPIANAEELRMKAKSRTLLGRQASRRSSLLHDRLLRSASKLSVTTDFAAEGGAADPNNTSASGLLGASTTDLANNNSNSSMNLDVAHLNESEISNHPHLPIHTKIAYELLEAHKLHIDQVMETLKVEMDALKDFELILLEQGPVRPTEEEVVEYFESLGLCLEQRKKAGTIMQKKMDRISQG